MKKKELQPNQFLEPTNNLIFLKMATEPQHQAAFAHCMQSFLFPDESQTLNGLILRDPRIIPDNITDKLNVTDVHYDRIHSKDQTDRFIVEMQKKYHTGFYERILYLVSNALTRGVQSGYNYRKVPWIRLLCILDFNLFPHKHCFSKQVLYDEENKTQYIKKVELHFVELRKFILKQGFLTPREEWITFLKTEEGMSETPDNIRSKEVRHMYDNLRKLNFTEEEYNDYLLIKRSKQQELDTIDHERKEGIKEGIEKGIEKGKKETAKQFLAQGVSVEVVAKATGIPKATLKKWDAENKKKK